MKDQTFDKMLVRAAQAVREQLHRLHASRLAEIGRQAGMVQDQLDRLVLARRRLSLALSRGWSAAAGKITQQIAAAVRDVPYCAGQVERAIEAAEMKIPPLQEIHADLQQLCEEFDGVRYSAAEQFLAATTEPIELEGILLGDFEIRLELRRLGDARSLHNACTIVALDPHPAGSNDAVTHPHVSDEHLCAGDAGAAIGAALTGGRVCDFFLLVQSVLTTYNADSPYVSLSEWSGQPCCDCGYTMGDGEDYFCTGCEESFCGQCSMPCMRCEETYCRGCLTQCRVCSDSFCHGCMTTCPECAEPLCQNCVDDLGCECLEEKPSPACLPAQQDHVGGSVDERELDGTLHQNR